MKGWKSLNKFLKSQCKETKIDVLHVVYYKLYGTSLFFHFSLQPPASFLNRLFSRKFPIFFFHNHLFLIST